jgi:putative ABC transport system substrate-binding protein
VAFLSQAQGATADLQRDAFLEALVGLGWTPGKDVVVRWHYPARPTDPLDGLASAIVDEQPDLILAAASAPAVAASRATKTIPVVFNSLGDPLSLVDSLEHPGGNMTGSLQVPPGFNQTKVDLLHEALPSATRIAILRSTTNPFPGIFEEMKSAAEDYGMSVQSITVRSLPDDIPAAIDEAVAGGSDVLLQMPDGTFTDPDQQRIAALAMQNGIAYFGANRSTVANGALLSIAPGTLSNAPIRVAAEYVDRVLKGARPGDLALRAAPGFEIVLNAKTAEAIGMKFPESVLAKATDVLR